MWQHYFSIQGATTMYLFLQSVFATLMALGTCDLETRPNTGIYHLGKLHSICRGNFGANFPQHVSVNLDLKSPVKHFGYTTIAPANRVANLHYNKGVFWAFGSSELSIISIPESDLSSYDLSIPSVSFEYTKISRETFSLNEYQHDFLLPDWLIESNIPNTAFALSQKDKIYQNYNFCVLHNGHILLCILHKKDMYLWTAEVNKTTDRGRSFAYKAAWKQKNQPSAVFSSIFNEPFMALSTSKGLFFITHSGRMYIVKDFNLVPHRQIPLVMENYWNEANNPIAYTITDAASDNIFVFTKPRIDLAPKSKHLYFSISHSSAIKTYDPTKLKFTWRYYPLNRLLECVQVLRDNKEIDLK
jgi:hypothetical protein